MNTEIKNFFKDGCGRCERFKSPACSTQLWKEELILLRDIILEHKLKEEFKWSQPCYTFNNKNVLILIALKDFACIGFLKAA